jgi:hypothetical protein
MAAAAETTARASATAVAATRASTSVATAANVAATNRSAAYVSAATNGTAVDAATAVSVAATTVCVSATSAVAVPAAVAVTAAPAPVVPGTGADEHAADEVVRPVVAVRCAAIGGIRVVAVIAGRWTVIVVVRIIVGSGNSRTHADSDAYSYLRAGHSRERHCQSYCQKYCAVIPHDILLVPPRSAFWLWEPEGLSVFST